MRQLKGRTNRDSAGRPLRQIRPNGRDETLYAYDLDGRLHQQVTKTAGTDWATTHYYDEAGRPVKVDYQDGSSATATYNPDSTVKTQVTRDGLTLTYTYDAADRPLSVVPSGTPGAGMAPLDSSVCAVCAGCPFALVATEGRFYAGGASSNEDWREL